ncbi:MAG: DnaJ domain-containing protein, partial [Rubrivivax sp.]|nr:DnaJ domain-containing protein [Rubrivivax sp.]
MTPDHYAVLGLSRNAEPEAIAGAYKALVRKYHPDSAGADAHAASRIREITHAYAVLSDPQARAAYDAATKARPNSAHRPSPPPPP